MDFKQILNFFPRIWNPSNHKVLFFLNFIFSILYALALETDLARSSTADCKKSHKV